MKFKRIICILLALLMLPLLPLGRAGAISASEDTELLWLVNKNHSVSSDYVADDLVKVGSTSVQMRADAAKALINLLSAAKNAGYTAPSPLSGYRSYSTQKSLFSSRVATRQSSGMTYQQAYDATAVYTAPPGTSEHQLGLAIDISLDGTLSSKLNQTTVGKWINANADQYGFILRYADAKRPLTMIGGEAWHYRYVGTPHAQIINENGWCLEEYIAALTSGKEFTVDRGDGTEYYIYRSTTLTDNVSGLVSFSSDNTGGYIFTTIRSIDKLANVKGHWSEPYFTELLGDEELPVPFVVNPSSPITRADFAVLYSYLGLDAAGELPSFTDLDKNAYYYSAVENIAKAGLMVGSDGKFSPTKTSTRETIAVAVANAIEDNTLSTIDYSDMNKISWWSFQSIQKLAHTGIMTGSDGKFNPKANITWGEAAALLVKLKTYLKNNESPQDADPETDLAEDNH